MVGREAAFNNDGSKSYPLLSSIYLSTVVVFCSTSQPLKWEKFRPLRDPVFFTLSYYVHGNWNLLCKLE